MEIPNFRRQMSSTAKWLIALAVIWLLFGFAPRMARFYTDWLWFGEVGYRSVFWTPIKAKLALGAIFGLGFFAIVWGNVIIARRLAPRAVWYQVERELRMQMAEAFERYVARYLYFALFAFVLLIAWAVGAGAAGRWETFLQYAHATPAGTTDPVFHRDLGFYLFRLPTLHYVWAWLYGTLFAAVIISAGVHYLDKAIRVLRGVPAFAPHVRAHLSVLVGIILAVKAFGYQLNAWDLLYSRRGLVFGASYVDLHAQLPVYYVLMAIALACALLVLVNLHFRGLWLPIIGIGFLMGASLLANVIYPSFVQKFVVGPSEFEKERPYIARHIAATRQAYDLERIRERDFAPSGRLTTGDLAANPQTMGNIRLWDYRPLRSTYEQLQELRQYYAFNDVDVDRYTIDGRYQQVLLSVRELSVDRLTTQVRTWQNQHLTYTHGYGLCLSPVNRVTAQGLPDLWVKDIPPASTTDLKITQPAIYYGELTDQYVLVHTNAKEFDFPRGDQNMYTTYDGDGGISVGNWFNRLAMSVRFGEMKILLSNFLTRDSKIMFRRKIAERVQTIAPFLTYDNDPYPVVGDDGRIFWMIDAYTTSSRYPYAEPIEAGSFNYLRNSVKVVVDAYHGTVRFYVADPADPVIRTYQGIFPGLFRPLDEMRADLRRHLRYPNGLFQVQAGMYATYHMRDPQVFYQKEDRWTIAREKPGKGGPADGTMEAYYVVMRLPGEADEEFVLMLPFSPATKQNMVAWLGAKCDPAEYGKLELFKFPKQELVYGPLQIETLIDQDPVISQQLTLWGQRGSEVIRGHLLVIPIGDTILYVEPLYLQASEGTRIPELRRVIVSLGKEVHMAETLAGALAAAVGIAPPAVETATNAPVAPTTPSSARAQAEQALREFQAARAKLRAGDWSGFGEELNRLEQSLRRLAGQEP
jgi:uncharacterized membrane protein (UPF0182 family)